MGYVFALWVSLKNESVSLGSVAVFVKGSLPLTGVETDVPLLMDAEFIAVAFGGLIKYAGCAGNTAVATESSMPLGFMGVLTNRAFIVNRLSASDLRWHRRTAPHGIGALLPVDRHLVHLTGSLAPKYHA